MATEVEKLMDFIAREVIEMVRKSCPDIANSPEDIKETAKDFLEGQNLKKRLFAAVKRNLKKPLPPLNSGSEPGTT